MTFQMDSTFGETKRLNKLNLKSTTLTVNEDPAVKNSNVPTLGSTDDLLDVFNDTMRT